MSVIKDLQRFFAIRILVCALLIVPWGARAGDSPAVDPRLAQMVEDVLRETGFRINISSSDFYSVNINTINGRNVCDQASAADVRKLQDAFNKHPNIHADFGPAYYSIAQSDGSRKILSPEALKTQGILKGCTNVYVSVAK